MKSIVISVLITLTAVAGQAQINTSPGGAETMDANVCCVDDSCYVVTSEECASLGGTWHYGYDSCENEPCYSLGVCCFEDGAHGHVNMFDCLEAGGNWLGNIPCDPNPCPIPCCNGIECHYLPRHVCIDLGGAPYDEGGSCDPNPCHIIGSCCIEWECDLYYYYDCLDMGGIWRGDTPCDPNPCPGACCVGWDCRFVSQDYCEFIGGEVFHPWFPCDPNPCVLAPVDDTSWGEIKGLYR